MNERTENDLRALLPALLADAERRGQTRQQTTGRIIDFIKKCSDINTDPAPSADRHTTSGPTPSEAWEPKVGERVEFDYTANGGTINRTVQATFVEENCPGFAYLVADDDTRYGVKLADLRPAENTEGGEAE